MRRRIKPILFVAALGALAVAVYLLPLRELMIAALGWIEAHRTVAWLVYIGGYVLATVLLIPGAIVTMGAGFIFGLPAGVAIVSAGSVLGASGAFLIGRFFVRDWAARKIDALPRFNALDRAVRDGGFTVVLLARLSPLFPFNLLNYGLGVSGVRFRDFFFGSWIGMLPGTVLYVYIGTLAADLALLTAGEVDTGWAGTTLLGVGFVATLALTVLITRRATRVLRAQLETRAAEPPVSHGSA